MAKGLGVRLEAMVGFQKKDDPFIKKFEEILNRIRTKVKDGWMDFEVTRDEDSQEIQDLLNQRFATNMHLVTDGDSASVIPFFATDNNILMREYFRSSSWLESENAFYSGSKSKKGWVDIDNAKLGGDFSKGKSTLYLNFNTLIKPVGKGGYWMTNREIIAVTLHEIGHTFYPLLHAAQLDRTNLILEQARKELMGKDADRRAITKTTLEKIGKGDATAIANDLCSESPDLYSKAAMKLLGETALQHQSNAKYSNTNFEMMADNFAVRFGFGSDLVKALEKLTPGGVRYGDIVRAIGETTAILSVILQIFGFVRTLGSLGDGPAKIVFGLLWFIIRGIAIVTFFYIAVRMSGESGRDYTYDDLVHRYNRIRMQMIADIKTRKLTKGDATKMIESIESIGNLIKEGRNWRTPLDFLFNTFNPADRRAKDSIGRQQAMEALVNNDLFLSSLKLNQLAG